VRIRWTRPALRDVSDILAYVAERDVRAAAALAESIERRVDPLREHPASGRSGRVAGTRELVISGLPYIVAYRVSRSDIEVLAVRHAARLWPNFLWESGLF
jgi:addiction module RelE/StbE family toxin